MATYSENTTIKVDGAVTADFFGNGTIYTMPANKYGIFRVWTITDNGIGDWVVNGSITVGQKSSNLPVSSLVFENLYLGPGQTLSVLSAAGVRTLATGVIFANTP